MGVTNFVFMSPSTILLMSEPEGASVYCAVITPAEGTLVISSPILTEAGLV